MEIKITQPAAPLTLTLTLSEREAMVLRTVFRNIGGSKLGPRSVTDDIETALREQGIGCYDDNATGNIYFPHKWSDLS